MSSMNRISNVDTYSQGEHVGLKESNRGFQSQQQEQDNSWKEVSKPHRSSSNHHRPSKSTNDFQQDMSRHHVCEQSDRQADESNRESHHFQRHHQSHHGEWRPRWKEHSEEGQSVQSESHDQFTDPDRQGQSHRHHQMRGHRERIRNQSESVTSQNEGEDREGHGEQRCSLWTDRLSQDRQDQLVNGFPDRLSSGRHQSSVPHDSDRLCSSSQDPCGQPHHQRGVRQGQIKRPSSQRSQRNDLKLF